MAKKTIYTYRNEQKFPLTKSADAVVVLTTPDVVQQLDIDASEISPLSPTATLVRFAKAAQVDPALDVIRQRFVAHHAYFSQEQQFLISDEILVAFKDEATEQQINALIRQYSLIEQYRYVHGVVQLRLSNMTNMNPVKLIVQLTENEALVRYCENNVTNIVKRAAVTLPDDALYRSQWHLHRDFTDPDYDPRSSSRCAEAWSMLGNFGDSNVVVAVTDDGCKLGHSDFNGPDKFASWGYFEGDQLITSESPAAVPDNMYSIGDNHGTQCCGVVAAERDGRMTVGAAPDVKLLPIRFEMIFGGMNVPDSVLLKTLNYLADKVDVISNSWGYPKVTHFSQAVLELITHLAQHGGRRGKGILFVWAAGNENAPLQLDTDIDIPYDVGMLETEEGVPLGVWQALRSRSFSNNLLGLPANLQVGAVSSMAKRSHYSCYGTGLDIAAPSNNVRYYGSHLRGLGITTVHGDSDSGTTHRFGGTSSAAPLVAGIAALVISADPSISATRLAALLKQTASKDLDFSGYDKVGALPGIEDEDWDVSPVAPFDRGEFQDVGLAEGTWSPWFGHGNVNAAHAVVAARHGLSPTTPEATERGWLSFMGRPDIAIPDNSPVGVRDTVTVEQIGDIADLTLTLKLEHAFTFDLIVELVAPNRQRINLLNQDRNASSNLHRVFTVSNTPQLATLINTNMQGDWLLEISDVVFQDAGTLQSWELKIAPSSTPTEVVSLTELDQVPPHGVAIGEVDFGVGRDIHEMQLTVELQNNQAIDLQATLIDPDRQRIPLGRVTRHVQQWFSNNNTVMADVLERFTGGKWQLQLENNADEPCDIFAVRWTVMSRPPVPPLPDPSIDIPRLRALRRGSKGLEVVKLQRRMRELGFYDSVLDGDFGAGTDRAVRQYQSANNLVVDGIVGARSWLVLFNQAYPDHSEIFDRSLLFRCLALTGSFETSRFVPECFAGLTGDFDRQGISFGALQWNFGQTSLPPLLRRLDQRYPDVIDQIFGFDNDENYAETLRHIIHEDRSKTEQVEWSRSIQIRTSVVYPWSYRFKALGRTSECQEIQLEFATDIMNRALDYCAEFGLTTERGVALMFDIVVQNGSMNRRRPNSTETVAQQVHREIGELPNNLQGEDRQIAIMEIIANRRAEAAKPQYVEDVRKRKLTAATGEGVVHGARFKLWEQYGIGLRPFLR